MGIKQRLEMGQDEVNALVKGQVYLSGAQGSTESEQCDDKDDHQIEEVANSKSL